MEKISTNLPISPLITEWCVTCGMELETEGSILNITKPMEAAIECFLKARHFPINKIMSSFVAYAILNMDNHEILTMYKKQHAFCRKLNERRCIPVYNEEVIMSDELSKALNDIRDDWKSKGFLYSPMDICRMVIVNVM